MNHHFELKNQDLVKLNGMFFQFTRMYADYANSIYNPHAFKVMMEAHNQILEFAQNIRPEDEFDKLFLRHIMCGLNAQAVFADYFSNPETKYTIQEVIATMHGPGTLNLMEKNIKRMPFRKQWERIQLLNFLRPRFVRNDTPEARSMIEKMIPKFKKNILKLGVENGFIPKKYDFELVLLPPYGEERSNFRAELNRLELSSKSFLCIRDPAKYRIQPALAYLEASHELLGHGGHMQFSLQFPSTLHLGSFGVYHMANKCVTEGVAMDREKWGIEYIKENKDKLELSDAELKSVILNNEVRNAELAIYPHYSILKERELKEKGFDMQKYLKENGFPYFFWKDTRWQPAINIVQAMFELAYIAGDELVKNVRERIEKEFGAEFVALNQAHINEALASGCWAWEVYPDFVIWYLKNVKKEQTQ
ncbi:hypothetical protein GF371_04135 [Candidatus Woesearchaeota archaeon]|nr:hypothetical protein [Candidatus Woesearchaeota archaeon]